MKNSAVIRIIRAAALSLLGVAALCSCDRIFEFEGDCSSVWKLDFRYDMNMKYADAFGHEADAVTLYAFDQDGTLVWQNTEQGDSLASEEYAMTLDLEPGVYDLVAWSCCDIAAEMFDLPAAEPFKASCDDLVCEMIRQKGTDGKSYVQSHLGSLMHGSIDGLEITEAEGTHTVRIPMTKNTNEVRVILQHLSGEDIDPEGFAFAITDRNASYSFDNTLLPCEEITYREWRKDSGIVGTRAVTSASALVAELTVGRLMLDNDPRLTVTNAEGEIVLSIPLIDYALLIKGHYDSMSDQEYLDRQDEYNMTFFLDDDMHWINTHIYINSWKVVLSDVDFE